MKIVKDVAVWLLANTPVKALQLVLITASAIFTPITAVPTLHYMKNARAPAKFAKLRYAQARSMALTTITAKSETAFVILHIQKLATPQKV